MHVGVAKELIRKDMILEELRNEGQECWILWWRVLDQPLVPPEVNPMLTTGIAFS